LILRVLSRTGGCSSDEFVVVVVFVVIILLLVVSLLTDEFVFVFVFAFAFVVGIILLLVSLTGAEVGCNNICLVLSLERVVRKSHSSSPMMMVDRMRMMI